MDSTPRQMTFGMIVGNRGFFPDHLAQSGRTEMIAAIEKSGHHVVAPGVQDTKFGAVETRAEARGCAEPFKKHTERIAGAAVPLPNFGHDRAVPATLRMSLLPIP